MRQLAESLPYCFVYQLSEVGGVEPKGRCALGHTRPL
jgi:hypothetical protein